MTFVAVSASGEVLAEARLRPWLAPPYRTSNGHAAYNVKHASRRSGVATAVLRELRRIARVDYGLAVLTLNVEGANDPSVRVILANEGRLVAEDIEAGRVVRWFECPTGDQSGRD